MSNIKQIETFYWTVKLGTLQRAADKLFITQSAATKRIKELEKNSAQPLFEVHAQKSTLSAKGEELLLAAESVLDSLNTLDSLRGPAHRKVRNIRIGITELVTVTWFTRFVKHLKSVYPDISLIPDVDLSARLKMKMLGGELDAIVVPMEYLSSDMDYILVDSVEFSWVAPPLSFRETMPITLKTLARLPIIIQGPQSGITTRCEQRFAQGGVEYSKVYGSNSLFALASLIRAGVGASCIPKALFQGEIDSGAFQEVHLETGIEKVDYHFAFLKHNHPSLGFLIGDLARQCVQAAN